MAEPGAPRCWRCAATIDAGAGVGRRDACLSCGADLRCCRNCRFHDPTMHNECREPQAERQVDKECGNFCDWFSLGGAAPGADPAATARARLNAMFGGKKGR